MVPVRRLRGVLSVAVGVALLLTAVALPAAPAVAATADTTISVGSAALGTFGSDMLGSNLTPWGGYWPNNRSAAPMHDIGLGLLRVGHGEKVYVDMEKWYPAHGQWNWDAPGTVSGVSYSFNEQIAWLKSVNIPVMYTLNDELSTAMLNQDGSLNYAEIAYAWAGHIKYLVDQGVNIKYVEIGNECDIAPGEGIQYPPVDNSSKTPSGKYVELHIGDPAYANGNNEYIRLWEAVVPAIKAAVPGIKVSAYPSGQGTVTSLSFPFDYLFQTAKSKPDFFPVHVYSFAAYQFVPTPQQLLDSTWQYSGTFVDWSNNVGNVAETLQGYGAPASLPIGITEWNYDGATQYDPGQGVNWGSSQANAMWDAVFAASVFSNAANGGMDLTTFWETFPGSNTDELFDDDYTTTTPRSQALGYKLLKPFGGGTVRTSTVTSSDNAIPYDWQNAAVTPSSVGGKRVECLATTDASGYRLLLINKNVTTAHTADVSLADLAAGTAVVRTYTSRASIAGGTPASSNASVAGSSFQVTLPPMSVSVVTVSGDVPPPPNDVTPPDVNVTSPSEGAVVSGLVPLAADASDTGSGIEKVEFFADGRLVGSDSTAPYLGAWDALSASPGEHTITAKATDKAGLPAQASVRVTVEGLEAALMSLAASPPLPSYAGKTTIAGTLRDGGSAPLPRDVRVSKSVDTKSWSFCATVTAASDSGAFAYADPRAITRRTYYRAQFLGDEGYAPVQAATTVSPRVKFSLPSAPYSVTSGSRVRVAGWMYPRHAAGTRCVKVVAWRQEGSKWVPRTWAWASVSNGTWGRTNYVGTVRLTGRGLWRVAAYHPVDSLHAATYSSYRSLRVR